MRVLDANGFTGGRERRSEVGEVGALSVPPTALVKATLKGAFNAAGQLVAERRSAWAAPASSRPRSNVPDGKEIVRLHQGPCAARRCRCVQNFETFALHQPDHQHGGAATTPFAYPPLPLELGPLPLRGARQGRWPGGTRTRRW
jgi:hypothetical protein